MHELFEPNTTVTGVKGLIFLGERIVGLVRDHNTTDHPGFIDMLGGASDPEDKTPFDTLAREVREESGLVIVESDITYARRYPGIKYPGTCTYFAVAKLAAEREAELQLGDEGTRLMLLTPEEFIGRSDGWDVIQDRTSDYLDSLRDTIK